MKNIFLKHIVLFLLWLLPLPLPGNNQPLIFRHLTIEDGLSQSAVQAIYQDRMGFVWIGTKDGLNKYDGYRFTIYQHDPFDSTTISNNYITRIFEDSRGYLWVGTREGGLNCLNRDTEHFQRFLHDPKNPRSLSSNRITTITEDGSGALWIGTRNGLNRLAATEITRAKPAFRVFRNEPQNPNSLSHSAVEALLIDRSDQLWIGTADGLNRLNLKNQYLPSPSFLRYYSQTRTPGGLMDDHVYSLYQSSGGDFWVGTSSGLNRLSTATNTFTGFPHHFHSYRKGWGEVWDIEETADGELWLATPDELMIFDPRNGGYRSYRNDPLNSASLNSNFLTCVMRDRSGVLWLGTNGYGLNLHDPKAKRFHTFRRPKDFPSRISGFSVRAMLEDRRGNLWISADVLYRWNRTTGKLKSFETDSKHPADFGNTGVWSMLQDDEGFIWTASFEGVYRYNPRTGNYRFFKKANDPQQGLREKVALNVFSDRDGYIWIGTENYFSRYNAATDRFRHYRYRRKPATREPSLSDVCQDVKGIFWLATDDGLVRFDPLTEKFRYFRNDPTNPHSLSHNVVLSLLDDPREPERVLWVGTAGGGLNRFRMDIEQFESFSVKDGLPNTVVYGVLSDKTDNLWLSTNKGLSRFDPSTGKFRNFDVNDGLQSNEFNTTAFYQSPSGEMFFGGIHGLNYFNPEQIIDNPYIPPVAITELRIFNRPVLHGGKNGILKEVISRSKELNLTYRQNIFSFQFAALDYSAPSRNQYAYKMDGFNEEWIPANETRTATFTNLPPGDYRFRVKAANNDGIWNEEGASLAIHVTPPPWRTWWAYAFYAIALLGVLLGVRSYELNRLRLKNILKVEQLEGDKLRELDQIKSRFFANISHEFRTPLTLILGQIDRVLSNLQDQSERRRLEVALGNSRRLLRLINQLLDLSRLEAGSLALKAEKHNLVPFLKNLIFSFESLAEQKRISLQCHCSQQVVNVFYEPEKLEKVFLNLLSNALKFTPEGERVKIAVAVSSNSNSPLPLPTGSATSAPAAKFVEIIVKDSGSGIPPDKLPHIFDRFYQGGNSNTWEWESSGIGLTLAKELVELHGGKISVESEPGKGSTFAVRLPIWQPQADKPPVKKDSNKQKNGEISPNRLSPVKDDLRQKENFSTSPLKVGTGGMIPAAPPAKPKKNAPILLIVEDHPDMRTYISDQLTDIYRVLEAGDGEEGLTIALERIPDLIISDVMMPKMDGNRLCTLLKQDEKTSHIPIIMLTAKAEMEDKIEGLESGVDDYLLKPFSSRELVTRVGNLIELRRKLREQFRELTVVKPAEVTAVPIEQAFLEKVLSAAETHLGEDQFDVGALAAAVSMSVSQLNRKLRALVDQPAGQLLRSLRLQRAANLLKQKAATVAEICYQVGFSDQANFSRAFKKQFGVAPGLYKRDG